MIFGQESSIDKPRFMGMMKVMTSYPTEDISEGQKLELESSNESTSTYIDRFREAVNNYKYALLIAAGVTLSSGLNAQFSNGLDYSIKSNIIDPDTLSGDEAKVFWHYVNKTSQELKSMEASQIKADFAKLGLVPEEKQRFIDAYFFMVNDVEAHKKSCENWEDFKYLAPKKEK